jgi:HD-like signal output (HDOD) protein
MAARASVSTPDLELPSQLIERLRTTEVRVPPYPAVASSLDRLNRDGRATVAEVASIVATDAALAATVLRHATSAAARSNAPATLETAVSRLGLDELTRVVIATTIGVSAGAAGPLAALRRDQWRRSLLSAMFCRELAGRRGVAPDQAFLAGLLHDFGAIVVVACIESLGAAALPVLPETTWRRMVEDLHIEFGMVVVARWQLPEPISEVVTNHHSPHACNRVYRPLVQLVAVVDQIITILDDSSRGGLAGLTEVAGLEHDERFRIGALMPKVAEQMAKFETTADRPTASKIAAETQTIEGSWPVDFAIASKGSAGQRACALAPTTLAFRSQAQLAQGWLAELTLQCPPDTITMLANVKSCQPMPGGGHLVIAQPFGLAGEDKAAWHRLVERTRRANAS